MTYKNVPLASNADATEIADDILYRTGQAMLLDDFSAFADCFAIPHLVETSEGKRQIETERELQDAFGHVRRNLNEKNVVDLVRTIVAAEFLEENVIGSTHVSVQTNKDGKTVCKPYPVYSIIKRDEDRVWRIESSIYAIIDDLEMNMVLHRKSAEHML